MDGESCDDEDELTHVKVRETDLHEAGKVNQEVATMLISVCTCLTL